ncbi:MAG: hypothetical protein O3B01_21430 [Planctomycetota bacterium]|nr:hypothetical protein [Planctomycetota bacterium]MDA1141137.1 hypothetical protein [Planctomycetota bacterium]
MPDSQPSLTNVDENRLAELICRARVRVVYLAPGITEKVASAIAEVWPRLGTQKVSVILDVDPEVCRLGYGTVEGLKAVQKVAMGLETIVCHQEGIRIGLLISDDTTLIYTPTPLLVEAGSSQPSRPNAIELSAVPKEVARAVGLDSDAERTIGLDPVKPERVDQVAQDIEQNPPMKFDLARKVTVFNSRFQFVEFELKGVSLSRKKVPIPSELMGLAQDSDARQRLHANFDLVGKTQLSFDENGKVYSEHALNKKKKDIAKRFLIPLKGYGNVVLRGNRQAFEDAVEDLRSAIKVFQAKVKTGLQIRMDENRKALVEALMPGVKSSPPDHYTKIHGPRPSDDALRTMLEGEIKTAFGSADQVVKEMEVSLVFKNVAYESLTDPDFIQIAQKAMPGLEILHDEFEAAKQSD